MGKQTHHLSKGRITAGAAALPVAQNSSGKEGIELGKEQGIEIGEKNAKRETALSLAEMGFPVERIAQVVKESISCVKQWIAEGTALAR